MRWGVEEEGDGEEKGEARDEGFADQGADFGEPVAERGGRGEKVGGRDGEGEQQRR